MPVQRARSVSFPLGEFCLLTPPPYFEKKKKIFTYTRVIYRDMYYEKWGFMLIFWNLSGVPLSYCHCTIYLANHHPDTYRWNKFALFLLYVAYIFVYWVWDTTNSQKNRFRQQQRGDMITRKTFPQLPWQTVENPKTITSKKGYTLLVDGWCKYMPNYLGISLS